jgi:hypothetical protein
LGAAYHGFLHRLDRSQQRAGAFVGHIVLHDLGLDRVQLRLRLPHADARLEAPNGDPVAVVSIPGELRHVERCGEKHLGIGRAAHWLLGAGGPQRVGEVEADRPDADDFAGNIVEADGSSDDSGVAMKQTLPEGVSQDGHVVVAFDPSSGTNVRPRSGST